METLVKGSKMEEIKSVIERYVEGTKTGNVEKLRLIFAPNAVMSGDLGELKLVIASPEIFFKDIEGEECDRNYRYVIEDIIVKGEIASVTLKEYNLKNSDFLNLFQLQKIDNEWKIISKLFTTT